MSPCFQDDHLPKINKNGFPPPHLKIYKDSHPIKKSSSNLTISSSPPRRTPVIIYTSSPKIIHTSPRDFRALVQKLTGMSRSADDPQVNRDGEINKNGKMGGNDDESSSVITTDENSGDGQVNSSCFLATNPYVTNIPVFTPNSAEFINGNQSYYNYNNDLLYFNKPNIKTSFSSSSFSALEGMNEFP